MKTDAISLGGSAPSNDAAADVANGEPYVATIGITGVADFLFHRWSVEAVEEKAKAAKGSKSKKTDNLESYVYRTEAGELAIPGEYLRMAMIGAAKFRQDPRSPRKSAMDLFKAALVCLTPLCSLQTKAWDFEDRRRVVVQRNGITRCRPGMREGWRVQFDFMVTLPEYISPAMLNDVAQAAGRLVGIGDFRPTYGRFQVHGFKAG